MFRKDGYWQFTSAFDHAAPTSISTLNSSPLASFLCPTNILLFEGLELEELRSTDAETKALNTAFNGVTPVSEVSGSKRTNKPTTPDISVSETISSPASNHTTNRTAARNAESSV
ncbi:Tripeptidyl-peptidase sed2 [Fusarium oxysporum f. sp. albedinis]|nr:Tripeptidyl-peptidase sed2 [Fusarium oxysporum f. sp. albedinis]